MTAITKGTRTVEEQKRIDDFYGRLPSLAELEGKLTKVKDVDLEVLLKSKDARIAELEAEKDGE